MTPEVEWVIGWIRRMGRRFGGVVYDSETGKQWDWGQALCRALYGPDWPRSAEWRAVNDDETHPGWAGVVNRAKAWECGEWPDWAWTKGFDPRRLTMKEEQA